ncbi:unannotated protein [freshwater metagenome]|uniref:Unannotated protein n=1 Tax=freshwater metagenome TaxID=449393 RepID=A0A6J7KNJ1_9ZZZZ
MSATLPMKPENGGMPARFIAGRKKRIARSGAVRASPPIRSDDVLPATRSIIPAVRNSVVWIVMWWIA